MSAIREQFLRDGYLVVPDVVPLTLCQQVIGAICKFTHVDVADPETWYGDERQGHGIVPLHHAQALWDLRQYPAVYEVFAEIYERRDLWVSHDRVSYKPPWSQSCEGWKQAPVHWDCDPWSTSELSIQGLVYLTDTNLKQGAFSCVPDIYQNLPVYLQQHKDDPERRRPVFEENQLVPIAGSAGSLVLFHRLMPHTSRLNRTGTHRFVQYVAMSPVPDVENEKIRSAQVKQWQDGLPPAWAVRQQVKGQVIPEPGGPANLTALGRKLVGVDIWEAS